MITVEYEVAPMNRHTKLAIDRLAVQLASENPVTREDAAKIVMCHGFAAYCGGRHVAIHAATESGEIIPGRLAMVTGDSPDFV